MCLNEAANVFPQEDKPWDWTRLFSEVSGDIDRVWIKTTQTDCSMSTSGTALSVVSSNSLSGKTFF